MNEYIGQKALTSEYESMEIKYYRLEAGEGHSLCVKGERGLG